MQSKRIFKSAFSKYTKLLKYMDLKTIREERRNQTFSFLKQLNNLLSPEEKQSPLYQTFIQQILPDDANPVIREQLMDLRVKMPYYKQLEIEFGQYLSSIVKGKIIYNPDTFQQKKISHTKYGYEFSSFVDVYYENKDSIYLFEAKAATSKKFLNMTYNPYPDLEKKYFLKTEKIFEIKPSENINQPQVLKMKPAFLKYLSNILNPDHENEKSVSKLKQHYHNAKLQKDYLIEEQRKLSREPEYEKYHQITTAKIDKLTTEMHQINKVLNFINKLSPTHDLGKNIYDVAYQSWILHQNNPQKNLQFRLVLFNGEYVHEGQEKYDNPALFSIVDLTDLMKLMQPIIEADIQLVAKHLTNPQLEKPALMQTLKTYTKIPLKNNLFTYLRSQHGFVNPQTPHKSRDSVEDLHQKNIYHALDVPSELLIHPDHDIQRKVIATKQPYYDYKKIRSSIGLLKYPIYHLDFETFPCPFPRFKGEKAYTQSVFQFSIHIEREPGKCDSQADNISYLAPDNQNDYRRSLTEKLLESIPDDGGSVVVYFQPFEKGRLEELAALFPEYSPRLNNIISRIIDLMDLVKGNTALYEELGVPNYDIINFYHDDLNGSYSIKKVLPIFSDLNYDNLAIKNGVEALAAYASFHLMSPQKLEQTKQDLLTYCQQDSYAMFLILKKLREISTPSN
ncbi:DUF2779 domain-containing protein [Candidatus Phytoplasma pruni]|uniref:DUF2779 domain-containing protein n=1 Tax=Candidatus Phytoplasma pruni TaxID=479893 RepID=A0A851HJZ1_9MOLU|nr:DUF2779 domain-containing protein [Candidatus Phytoplasma pruni]NWN45759.1 DUF2779 domain-containing protein [Candidatus Phytoplasma pruni]